MLPAFIGPILKFQIFQNTISHTQYTKYKFLAKISSRKKRTICIACNTSVRAFTISVNIYLHHLKNSPEFSGPTTCTGDETLFDDLFKKLHTGLHSLSHIQSKFLPSSQFGGQDKIHKTKQKKIKVHNFYYQCHCCYKHLNPEKGAKVSMKS